MLFPSFSCLRLCVYVCVCVCVCTRGLCRSLLFGPRNICGSCSAAAASATVPQFLQGRGEEGRCATTSWLSPSPANYACLFLPLHSLLPLSSSFFIYLGETYLLRVDASSPLVHQRRSVAGLSELSQIVFFHPGAFFDGDLSDATSSSSARASLRGSTYKSSILSFYASL